MKNLKIARMRYVALLTAKHAEHGLNVEQLNEMELTELRDMVDEYYPTTITTVSGTVSGGTSKSTVQIKKAS